MTDKIIKNFSEELEMRFIFAFAFIFVGCTSSPGTVRLPNGQVGYSVKCYFDIDKCYNRAAEICGGAYEVVNSSSNRDSDGDDFSKLLFSCKR